MVNLLSKLDNNSKLTKNEYKERIKNFCFYYGVGDYMLDFYLRK